MKKLKRSGFETDTKDTCAGCDRAYDITLGGWVVLASGQLICDPVDSPNCWEKVATSAKEKEG